VSSGKFLPMFQDYFPVPSSRVRNPKWKRAVPIRSLYREECGQL